MMSARLCLALTLGVAFAAGCGSSKKTEPLPLKTTGFLSSYDGLTVNDKGNYAYRDKSVDLKTYDAFLIEPVAVKMRDDIPADSVSPEVARRARRYMEAALTNAIAEHYVITDKPGAGVLRCRSAVTGLWPSGDGHRGAAAAEFELLDSVTGQRIVTVVAHDVATVGSAHPDKPWDDARAVMDVWAGRIRANLDEVHGVKPQLMPQR